jgi:hypothetical protein
MMKITEFRIGGIQFLRARQCWLGSVSMTLQAEGEKVAHDIDVKVRVKGDIAQSYVEVEEAIRFQAAELLSRASHILLSGSADEFPAQL